MYESDADMSFHKNNENVGDDDRKIASMARDANS